MGFTPAELAEMARADAEIESTFCVTNADIALGRLIDREAILGRMDSKQKRIAEAQRRYREAHKEEIAEAQRRYYEAHKEEIVEYQRRYREAHKEEIVEYQRRYREAHKEEIAEGKRRYRETHKEELAEAQRRYYEAHREEIAEGKRKLRDARIALGLTQREAAELLGVVQSTVCYWETISPPKNWREMLEKLTERA